VKASEEGWVGTNWRYLREEIGSFSDAGKGNDEPVLPKSTV
jgi:hypothetical protein